MTPDTRSGPPLGERAGASEIILDDELDSESTGYAHASARRGAARWPAVTAICSVCRRDVSWLRTDARYCSGACRQRAYRARKAVAS